MSTTSTETIRRPSRHSTWLSPSSSAEATWCPPHTVVAFQGNLDQDVGWSDVVLSDSDLVTRTEMDSPFLVRAGFRDAT